MAEALDNSPSGMFCMRFVSAGLKKLDRTADLKISANSDRPSLNYVIFIS